MPFTEGYPFKRLGVDYLVLGVTKVWWEFDRLFKDPGPYTFQLQASRAGVKTATDWVNVGAPAVNVGQLEDDAQRVYGKRIDAYYRVVLSTPNGTYASKLINVAGELREKDWLLAREIVRKERLRHGLVSVEGYLLRRIRYGEPNTENLDPLIGGVLDSRDRTDYGTGFKGGYFAPVPMQCWDIGTSDFTERRGGDAPRGPVQDTSATVRVLGQPSLFLEDVWVNAKTDERWVIEGVTMIANVRGVPVVQRVTMNLLPFTHVVYRVELGGGGEPASKPGPELPTSGDGCVPVDHDFGGPDNLAYQSAEGCGVAGATITAFRASDYQVGLRGQEYVVASGHTVANGRWAFTFLLDPGRYMLVFEKTGELGPDVVQIVVTDPASSSSSSTPSSPSSFSSSLGM